MKYDYWFARQLVVITGIILIVQLLTEVVGTRKPEFWWVLPVCAGAWAVSMIYAVTLIILNAGKR